MDRLSRTYNLFKIEERVGKKEKERGHRSTSILANKVEDLPTLRTNSFLAHSWRTRRQLGVVVDASSSVSRISLAEHEGQEEGWKGRCWRWCVGNEGEERRTDGGSSNYSSHSRVRRRLHGNIAGNRRWKDILRLGLDTVRSSRRLERTPCSPPPSTTQATSARHRQAPRFPITLTNSFAYGDDSFPIVVLNFTPRSLEWSIARQGETTARYLIQLDSLSAPNAKSTPTERRLLSQHVPALIASRDLSDA
ncbi:hypothetical protein HZH66_007186 [Vespula vulgaris]|uniref:Uncharacterized protein n=1 Tax=Vespula vulgaris TaxID=7454 RepID=A0A834JX33_VESVU|nr:hypothetical protein HZH66_007186 [Vespula vulgaris]